MAACSPVQVESLLASKPSVKGVDGSMVTTCFIIRRANGALQVQFQTASEAFHRVFQMPIEEKLVNCKLMMAHAMPCPPWSLCTWHHTHLVIKHLDARVKTHTCPTDYSCNYWTGNVPRQGWIYLSSSHLCFYAYVMGRQTQLKLPWTDVMSLSTTKLLMANGIVIKTRFNEVVHCFAGKR